MSGYSRKRSLQTSDDSSQPVSKRRRISSDFTSKIDPYAWTTSPSVANMASEFGMSEEEYRLQMSLYADLRVHQQTEFRHKRLSSPVHEPLNDLDDHKERSEDLSNLIFPSPIPSPRQSSLRKRTIAPAHEMMNNHKPKPTDPEVQSCQRPDGGAVFIEDFAIRDGVCFFYLTDEQCGDIHSHIGQETKRDDFCEFGCRWRNVVQMRSDVGLSQALDLFIANNDLNPSVVDRNFASKVTTPLPAIIVSDDECGFTDEEEEWDSDDFEEEIFMLANNSDVGWNQTDLYESAHPNVQHSPSKDLVMSDAFELSEFERFQLELFQLQITPSPEISNEPIFKPVAVPVKRKRGRPRKHPLKEPRVKPAQSDSAGQRIDDRKRSGKTVFQLDKKEFDVVESTFPNTRDFHKGKPEDAPSEKKLSTECFTTTFGVEAFQSTSIQPDEISKHAAKLLGTPLRTNFSSALHRFKIDVKSLCRSGHIVLITGASGSGKTTMLNQIRSVLGVRETQLKWNPLKSILSHVEQGGITIMSSIGLNSIPTQHKSPRVLSQGERHRAETGRRLERWRYHGEYVLIDEFTSPLDRNNARSKAAALRKYVTREVDAFGGELKTIVLATCNIDIIPYLQPDIVIDINLDHTVKVLKNPNATNAERRADIKVRIDPTKPHVVETNSALSHVLMPVALSPQFKDFPSKAVIDLDHQKVYSLNSFVHPDRFTSQSSKAFDFKFKGEITKFLPYIAPEQLGNVSIAIFIGPSGSGKTTLAEKLYGRPDKIEWKLNRSVISHFETLDVALEKLSAVCIPIVTALKPYDHLSQGEQSQCDVARCLGRSPCIVDEFTSFLDRPTAFRVARGVTSYVHHHQLKNCIFMACHSDIIAVDRMWPCAVVDVPGYQIIKFAPRPNSFSAKQERGNIDVDLEKPVNLLNLDPKHIFRRPSVTLDLNRTHFHTWKYVHEHHYKSGAFSKSARCFEIRATFDDIPEPQFVGIISWIRCTMQDVHTREHRTVIKPDYQCMGFGSRASDALAEYLAVHGLRYMCKTAHVRYGEYRDHSPLWTPFLCSGKEQTQRSYNSYNTNVSEKKIFTSHAYMHPVDYPGSKRSVSVEKYLRSRMLFVDETNYAKPEIKAKKPCKVNLESDKPPRNVDILAQLKARHLKKLGAMNLL